MMMMNGQQFQQKMDDGDGPFFFFEATKVCIICNAINIIYV